MVLIFLMILRFYPMVPDLHCTRGVSCCNFNGLYSLYSHYTHITLTLHSHYTHSTLTLHSHYTHITLTLHSQYTHITLTIHSHYTQTHTHTHTQSSTSSGDYITSDYSDTVIKYTVKGLGVPSDTQLVIVNALAGNNAALAVDKV